MTAPIPSRFSLDQDFDVYCYLKAHLPPPYRIESRPSAAYYSEWEYHYCVHHGEEVVATLEGDFRKIAPGSLVETARALLKELDLEVCNADW